jgi:hypothetical protein
LVLTLPDGLSGWFIAAHRITGHWFVVPLVGSRAYGFPSLWALLQGCLLGAIFSLPTLAIAVPKIRAKFPRQTVSAFVVLLVGGIASGLLFPGDLFALASIHRGGFSIAIIFLQAGGGAALLMTPIYFFLTRDRCASDGRR